MCTDIYRITAKQSRTLLLLWMSFCDSAWIADGGDHCNGL